MEEFMTREQWHLHATKITSENVKFATDKMRDLQVPASESNEKLKSLLEEAFKNNPGYFDSIDHLKEIHFEAVTAKGESVRKLINVEIKKFI
jgi:hypothetical protein